MYINPEYLENVQAISDPVKKTPDTYTNLPEPYGVCNYTKVIETAGPENLEKKQEVAQKNQMLIRNLSGSDSYDKLNSAQLEGWNQLSSVSNDLENENERLLSSRCGSVASSTAKTFATTDSMTNVTRMTVSSVDLSETSKSSESLSSPISSIQSSDQSSSDDPEDTMDSDQYWHSLWKTHYETQYQENYSMFMSERLRPGVFENLNHSPDKIKKRALGLEPVEHLLEKLGE